MALRSTFPPQVRIVCYFHLLNPCTRRKNNRHFLYFFFHLHKETFTPWTKGWINVHYVFLPHVPPLIKWRRFTSSNHKINTLGRGFEVQFRLLCFAVCKVSHTEQRYQCCVFIRGDSLWILTSKYICNMAYSTWFHLMLDEYLMSITAWPVTTDA